MAIKNKVEAKKITAAGVLFVHDSQLLLIKRSRTVVSPNVWCGAGGKIEPGETPLDAAIRECSEEIDYPSDHHCDFYPLYNFVTDDLVFHNYLGVLTRDRFRPSINWESDGWAWFDLQTLPVADQLHFGFKTLMNDSTAFGMVQAALKGEPIGQEPEYRSIG